MNSNFKTNFQKAQENKGYFFSNDKERVEQILDALMTNRDRYGYMACPCRLASGERTEDRSIICPCDYRKEDVEEYGTCYCGLFVKDKEIDVSGIKVPERHVYE